MATTAQSVSIARPADEVWAVLADFGGISGWAPGVDHSCLTTEQRQGVGTRRRAQVGRHAMLELVVEWAPGERLAYAIEGLPAVVGSVVNAWDLDESAGVTTVTLASSVDAGPKPPQQVAARVLGRALSKASVGMLGGLKHRLEEAAP